MPNNDLKKALALAQRMDQQRREKEDYESQKAVDNFLKIISQIESSGGTNFNHRPITQGIQSGTTAAGQYGLMPNTIREIEHSAANSGYPLSNKAFDISQLPADKMKQQIEANPQVEGEFAQRLADKVLTEFPNEQEAAYSWKYGHNLEPKEVEQRDYQNSDYVKKYNRFKKKLFGE